MSKWDLIIIGAGAAGLMAALTAGRRGRRVLLLEHNREAGRKILISGGGRCNFTNLYAAPENYLSQNPHFCKSALARYSPWGFIALVEQYGIAYAEKKLGQLFCRDSARQILDLLLSECQQAGVVLQTGVSVQRVSRHEAHFEVHSSERVYKSEKLLLASGGLSIPKIGASDLGYRILKQFGHKIVPPRPGLVPLTHSAQNQALSTLRGISTEVSVRLGSQSFQENLLFAHFGLSGPAILQISSFWHSGQELEIDFLPGQSLRELGQVARQEQPERYLHNWLKVLLPQRLVQFWKDRDFVSRPLQSLQEGEWQALEAFLHHWAYVPAGTSGYAKAEVTVGGADTRFFSSKNMESSLVPGLFCVGELLDVTGWLGGYNFHWAWASGNAAGLAV